MLQSTGETTPPCGVPVTPPLTTPASITPARSIARSSLRTWRSTIRSSTAWTNRSCGIDSKHEAISVSTTQRRPRHASSMRTCKASWAVFFGRNPNEHGNMSASKIGSMTSLRAACTMRSPTAGIDSGRCSADPGLGIHTRRAGSGRQLPRFRLSASLSSSRSTPNSSTCWMVNRSMPAAPRLRRTNSHARSKTSLR